MRQRVVLKLGGSSLQDPQTLQAVIGAVRGFLQFDYSVVVVHGGGPLINQALTAKGITWQFINGQRQTTPEMMSVIEEVLAHQVNQSLVNDLNGAGIPAVGISGAENNTLFCQQASRELGQVGKVIAVNTHWIERLLQASGTVVPVIAPIGIGAGGDKYNINADWAAAKLATALGAKKLIFLTDQKGILDPQGQVIESADLQFLDGLVTQKVVTGGMQTKVLTVMDALRNGVGQVRVMSGRDSLTGLWSDRVGTNAYV